MPSTVLPATKKILYTLLGVAAVVILLPQLLWLLMEEKPLKVVVVDKTVGSDFREHASLFWLLNHWKIVKPEDGVEYNSRKDYYGFHPADSIFDTFTDFNLSDCDILYLADTYGVYRYPMDYDMYERLVPKVNIPALQLYGGFTEQEVAAIERFSRTGGMLVAEFNTLHNPAVRHGDSRRLQRLLGIQSEEVVGKYYEKLDDAPLWMKELYSAQTKMKWEFDGSGIIITDARNLHQQFPIIIVLDADDMNIPVMSIRKKHHPIMDGVADEVPYYYFFEYVKPETSAVVLAEFSLNCTERGYEKMRKANLPTVFPAVVAADSSLRNFYCTGDFADSEVTPLLMRFYGAELPLYYLYSVYYVSNQTRFFWRMYVPMMKNIFSRADKR